MQLAQQAICDPHIEVFTHVNIIYDLYADLVNAEYVTGPPKRIFNRANICIFIYVFVCVYGRYLVVFSGNASSFASAFWAVVSKQTERSSSFVV